MAPACQWPSGLATHRTPLTPHIAHHGCKCAACGFDFAISYGEPGRDFIHVHHLKPLRAIVADYEVDPKSDLVPVCPNCHAMIHRSEPCLTIAQLREHLK